MLQISLVGRLVSAAKKNPGNNLPGVLSTYELFVFFSHPDFTVGSGILTYDQSPDQPPYAGRGLYRR